MTKDEVETPGLAILFHLMGALTLVVAIFLFLVSFNDRTTDSQGSLIPDQSRQYSALYIGVSSIFLFGFGGLITRVHNIAQHTETQTKLLASIANNTVAPSAGRHS